MEKMKNSKYLNKGRQKSPTIFKHVGPCESSLTVKNVLVRHQGKNPRNMVNMYVSRYFYYLQTMQIAGELIVSLVDILIKYLVNGEKYFL